LACGVSLAASVAKLCSASPSNIFAGTKDDDVDFPTASASVATTGDDLLVFAEVPGQSALNVQTLDVDDEL